MDVLDFRAGESVAFIPVAQSDETLPGHLGIATGVFDRPGVKRARQNAAIELAVFDPQEFGQRLETKVPVGQGNPQSADIDKMALAGQYPLPRRLNVRCGGLAKRMLGAEPDNIFTCTLPRLGLSESLNVNPPLMVRVFAVLWPFAIREISKGRLKPTIIAPTSYAIP